MRLPVAHYYAWSKRPGALLYLSFMTGLATAHIIPTHISIMIIVIIMILVIIMTISVRIICAYTRTGWLSTLARLRIMHLLVLLWIHI